MEDHTFLVMPRAFTHNRDPIDITTFGEKWSRYCSGVQYFWFRARADASQGKESKILPIPSTGLAATMRCMKHDCRVRISTITTSRSESRDVLCVEAVDPIEFPQPKTVTSDR